MRYPDDQGFVWKTIALTRDLVASHLKQFNCFIAFPVLTGRSAHVFRNMTPVELDCYGSGDLHKQKLARFIKERGVVAIVYMSALPSTLDMAFLRAVGVMTVNTENDSFDRSKTDSLLVQGVKFLVRTVAKRGIHDLHIANAESQGEWLRRHAKIPSSHLAVVPNGVDCNYYKPSLQNISKAPGRQIICVGQARAEKRIEWVIRAAAAVFLQPEFADVSFVYVGDGPMLATWVGLANDLQLKERFVFAGRKSDLLEYYQSAFLMVHAAERESFGLAVVEAMACALPVVACRAAGPSETICDGETGALVGIEDEEGFRLAIAAYLRNPEMARRHGDAGRQRANERFSISRQAEDIAKVIEDRLRQSRYMRGRSFL
ncbi:glycosyltransferase [Pseudorhodoferax soli]|nr:glycosyltransferase [Pseudorhodoferax soli]